VTTNGLPIDEQQLRALGLRRIATDTDPTSWC
jgi:hypothetical protein